MANEAPHEREIRVPADPYQLPAILRPGHMLLRSAGRLFDRLFDHPYNPMHQLGGLLWFFFWMLVVTGAYLYLFYEMTPAGAYRTVREITEGQRWFGGIIRSLHRYASGGLMLVTAAHMYHVFFSGRVRRHRWLAWITGLVVLPLIWFEGASGYVMVWDDRGLMAALEFAKWFDVLPLAVEPFSRNFVPGGSMNQLFFFLLSYLHLVIPCGLIIILWVHNLRQSRPRVWPYAPLAWAMFVTLLLLSVFVPALSGAPADLRHLTGTVNIDWFYLAVFPLANAYAIAPAWLWTGVAATFGVMATFPWLMPDEGNFAPRYEEGVEE